jgi:4-amino-4-deoxy-L-arabinose transferase-like glycosyltransferase
MLLIDMNQENSKRKSRRSVILLLALCILVFLLRLPYTAVNLWDIDEAGFAAVADKLVDGGVLYKDAFDNKPPLMYWFCAAVFSLFGRDNMLAIHIVALLIGIISLCLLYELALRLFSQRISIASACIYAFYLVAAPYDTILAANSEIYLVPVILSGIIITLIAVNTNRARYWLGCGLCLGIAAWTKQPAIFYCAIVPIASLASGHPINKQAVIRCMRACLCAFAGFCLVAVAVLTVLWYQGSLNDFLDAVILYNTKIHIASIPLAIYIRMAVAAIKYNSITYFAIVGLTMIGFLQLIGILTKKHAIVNSHGPASLSKKSIVILFSWLFLGVSSISVGGRFFSFYLYVLAPVVAIIAAIPFEQGLGKWRAFSSLTRAAIMSCLLMGISLPLYLYQSGYFSSWYLFIERTISNKDIYNPLVFSVAAEETSKYIKNNTAKTDHIFIWGYHPHIYVATGRCFSTRYFSVALQTGFVWGTAYQLSGWIYNDYLYYIHPNLKSFTFKPSDTAKWIYPGSQELLLKDLKADPPELFVDGNVPSEWPFGTKYPIVCFPKFNEFLSNNYAFEKKIIGYRIYRRLKKQTNNQVIKTTSQQGV